MKRASILPVAWERAALIACCLGLLSSGCGGESAREGETQQAISERGAAELQTVTLDLTGMTCQGCADAIHGALARHEGVVRDSVSLADSVATVTFDPEQVDVPGLVKIVGDLGYGASPIEPAP